jgi:hypothetical protein
VGLTRRARVVYASKDRVNPLILGIATPARAQFYVRSPEVSKGELKIEEHGSFYSGAGEDEHLNQTHELEGKYGITERFEVILEGVFEDEIGEDFVAEEIELGGQYEIIERHGDGLGLAFRTLYEFSLLGGPDEILFGPLAKVVSGPNSATINTFFVGQVGVQQLQGKVVLDAKPRFCPVRPWQPP